MSNIKISIDKINIRLKGVSPQDTQRVSQGLSDQILRSLADSRLPQTKSGAQSMGTLEAGTIHVTQGTTPDTIQKQIAAQIANSVGTVSRKRWLEEP